jgi:hypothetical protein
MCIWRESTYVKFCNLGGSSCTTKHLRFYVKKKSLHRISNAHAEQASSVPALEASLPGMSMRFGTQRMTTDWLPLRRISVVTDWCMHEESARNVQCPCRGLTLKRLTPNKEKCSESGINFCCWNSADCRKNLILHEGRIGRTLNEWPDYVKPHVVCTKYITVIIFELHCILVYAEWCC